MSVARHGVPMLLSPAERHFHSLVVSNSWGMFQRSWDFPPGNPGRYGDNPAHPFNIIVASLATAGAGLRQLLIGGAKGGGAWQADIGHGIVDTSGFANAGTALQ